MGTKPLLLIAVATCLLAGDDNQHRVQERQQLMLWQPLVGDWRGVGQPRRGSNKDAWTEQCGWAWSFQENHAALELTSADGKYLQKARLAPGAEPGHWELIVTTANGGQAKYAGAKDENGSLVLSLTKDIANLPSRITIRFVAEGDRMLVLYERSAGPDRYLRLAEVGFTRKGSDFGKGTSYIECVVTGGVGTIPVTHEGRTYYVCCTGCRDYFLDHPAEVLAEYQAQKEAEKKKKAK